MHTRAKSMSMGAGKGVNSLRHAGGVTKGRVPSPSGKVPSYPVKTVAKSPIKGHSMSSKKFHATRGKGY